ncbi:MAG: hypothetical protein EXS55_00110 [Candidatus Magasanikbacteria bacterium]|nr:hypothetical protein [Candidatus Magasanikbacteria bacterium]
MRAIRKKFIVLAVWALTAVIVFSNASVPLLVGIGLNVGPDNSLVTPVQAATSLFSPSAGNLVLGTPAANSATNVGSYRGTLATDNLFWSFVGTPTGFNAQVDLGGVSLNGANKLLLTTETANVTTARNFFIQICDWASSTGVDNVADAQCTGGGWRTLNNPKATAFTETADTSRTFEIFNGYFYTGTNPGVKVATPLTNFVSNSTVRIRFFSTVNSLVQFNLDRVQLEAAIDPVYYPDSYNPIAPFAGAVNGDYLSVFTNNATRQTITNTVANPLSFYYSFKNIQTYTGANTILVAYNGGFVSNLALTYNVAIWNFNSSSWENLNAAPIVASAINTLQSNFFAKSNVTLANYISSGETRILIFSTVGGTQTLGTDQIYITVGSVNTDTNQSEISFGQLGSGTSAATADLAALTTATVGNTWTQTTCLNNTAPCATTPYPTDGAGTWGTNYSASANVTVPITVPAGAAVTGIRFAARFRSNVTANTVQLGLKDYSGQFAGQTIAGGWSAVGGTNALTTFTFTDGIFQINPQNFIDTVNNVAALRLRTSASTAVAPVTRDWDFALVSVRWITPATNPPPPTFLSFSISTSTAGFGLLYPHAARYATASGAGAATETEAHTLAIGSDGVLPYVITVQGDPLGSVIGVINAIGPVNTASMPGTNQFGLRIVISNGSNIITTPYMGAGFAYGATGTSTSMIVGGSTLVGAPTTVSVRYVANVAPTKPTGEYQAALTYVVTATY